MPERISMVVSAIGLPELWECLATVPRVDEVVVALDCVGRRHAGLGSPEPVEARLAREYPDVRVVRNEAYDDWHVGNQTLNVGMEAASGPWVFITHEDTLWPEWDYPGAVRAALGQGAAGVTFPHQNTDATVPYPNWPQETWVQLFSPVSSLLSRDFWRELGGFGHDGIWYDAQVQEELARRDRWLAYVESPPVVHRATRSLQANGWAQGWALAPIWGQFDQRFQAKYGHPFHRGYYAMRPRPRP